MLVSHTKESQKTGLDSPVDSVITCRFMLGHFKLSFYSNVPRSCGQGESSAERISLPLAQVPQLFSSVADQESTVLISVL